MNVPTPTEFDSAAWSKSETCFYLHDDATAGTTYGSAAVAAGGDCQAQRRQRRHRHQLVVQQHGIT